MNLGARNASLADRLHSAASSEANRIRIETQAVLRRPSSSPITWQELCEALDTNNLQTLGRSPHRQEQYIEKRREIAKKFKIGYHYILNRVWGISLMVDPESGLLVAVQDHPKDEIICLQNDFPYNLELGVSHHILWAGSESSLKLATSDFENLTKYLPAELHDKEIRWCINPLNLQSVKEIPHAHIFSRSKSQ